MAWRCPTRLIIQPGGVEALLPSVAATLGTTFALVTDKGLENAGLPGRVEALLRAAGLPLRLKWTQVEENPSSRTAEALGSALAESGATAVIALGGGSVIDAAKAAAMLATNARADGGRSALAYEGRDTFARPGLPLLALPSTCGTGSEVTWVSVLTDEAQRRKFSVKGRLLFPAAAIVDAHLLATLPPQLVAYTGVDALTHALEATLSRPGVSNPISDALAEEAAVGLLGCLRAAKKGDEAALAAAARASALAGLAFGNADVGAVHCLSETLGGLYGVPHGLGNALFLAPALRHHLRTDDGAARGGAVRARLARLAARAALDAPAALGAGRGEGAELLLSAVEALVRDLRIPPFSALAIPAQEWGRVAELAVANGSNSSASQQARGQVS